MSSNIIVEPVTDSIGSPLMDSSSTIKMDSNLENASEMEVDTAEQDRAISLENMEHNEQTSINISDAAMKDENMEAEAVTVILLTDTSSLQPISSTSDISAAIGPSTTSDAITMARSEVQPQSPLRSIQAQSVPLPKSEVPSLLLRMGPQVADSGTSTSNALPIKTPGSPSKVLPQRPLPDGPLMDKPLRDRPIVDTWFPADELRAFQANNVTDTYIAPPSPPLRSSGTANPPYKRRLERSPPRTRYEGDGERYPRTSRTEEESHRGSTRRDSWRDEHLPVKRYKAEKEDYSERGHMPRGDSWQPRYDDRVDIPASNSHRRHDDNRSRHHRSPSVERRSDWGTRGVAPRARDYRGESKRSPSVERRSDWGTRGISERGHDPRGDGDRDEHRHRNGARETNGHRDSRNRSGELSTRTRRDEDSRRSAREDDTYNRRTESSNRTREYVEVAQRQPTRHDQRDYRTINDVDRLQRSAGEESSNWDRNSKKPHEDQARDTRSSYRSPTRQNGREAVSTSAVNGSADTNQRSMNGTGRARTPVRTARSPPSEEQQKISVGPKPGSYQTPSVSQRPAGYGNVARSNPTTTGGWPRTAVNGSISVPVDTRRGYDSPKPAPPKGLSHSSSSLTQHVPKDTLAPPLQDKEYIIAKYAAQKHLVKSVWVDNPKAPVANFLTGGKGGANGLGPRGPAYRVTMGRLGGINITRATLPIRGHPSIIGTGDDPIRVQAEKLACLSALFQLAEAGLVKCEEQPVEDPPVESADIDDADSEEVTQLSTGETITLREARAFMDYYCKRFGFGQPEISYETVAMRAGPQKWEAIMEVGGKKIGLGAGTTKKMATRVCYLDVTSYLEKCDQELWREYVEHAKGQAT